MGKLSKILKTGRMITLLIFLFIAIYAIHPNPNASGVAIRSVIENSSANIAGIENPKQNINPMNREVISSLEIEGKTFNIVNEIDYYNAIEGLEAEQTVKVYTNEGTYTLKTKPKVQHNITDELIEVEVPVMEEVLDENNESMMVYVTENITYTINESLFDAEGNEVIVAKEVTEEVNVTTTETRNKTISTIIGMDDIGLSVFNAPTTNLRKGLDLQGGSRVLLEPETELNMDDMEILKANMEKRLNIYGLSDIIVRIVKDKPFGSPRYILVEIPGATESEVEDLISKQGKFEAKIGNESVFKGGSDIVHVCRTADCAGIDPGRGCGSVEGGWACTFRFSITLSPEAAERQANITKDLEIIPSGRDQYLSKDLVLMLDDLPVDQLKIGSDLKGRAVTDIQISGSGSGNSRDEAIFNSIKNMKKLQTVLITGSLPVKLNVLKTDNVSPLLGEEFVQNSIVIGLAALGSVVLVVFIRYRSIKIAAPIMFTMLSEVVLLLGFAAFIKWNLDIAAIAGIIVAVGTGVDHLIVISDAVIDKSQEFVSNWKQRFKNAFFIIMAAFFTSMFAMMPLLFAGAGLLKGFALTTIAGISFGVLLVRPAYAKIVEILMKE